MKDREGKKNCSRRKSSILWCLILAPSTLHPIPPPPPNSLKMDCDKILASTNHERKGMFFLRCFTSLSFFICQVGSDCFFLVLPLFLKKKKKKVSVVIPVPTPPPDRHLLASILIKKKIKYMHCDVFLNGIACSIPWEKLLIVLSCPTQKMTPLKSWWALWLALAKLASAFSVKSKGSEAFRSNDHETYKPWDLKTPCWCRRASTLC